MTHKLRRSNEQPDQLVNLLNETVKNLEECAIVWLDPNLPFLDAWSTQLRSIVNYLKIFRNTDRFMEYMTTVSVKCDQIFLIVSGKTGKYIVPLIHQLIHVNSIYIFCSHSDKHKLWVKDFPKIRGIFVEESLLYKQLHSDVLQFLSQLPLTLILNEKTSQELHESGSFIWFQLLLEVLVRFPTSIQAKDDMIQQSLLQYQGNPVEMIRIECFRNTYSPEDAIRWYTLDSFIYRLVNKALRSEDIDQIFKYRFFICDLYKKLEQLHSEYLPTITQPVNVYRGQIMAVDEFKKIERNVSKYISVNTFFSTSTSSEVALGFLSGASSRRPAYSLVLFEIEIDATVTGTKPFAGINQWSVNRTEYEVLFAMGTIFQIQECYSLTEDISIVKLRLSNEQDEDMKEILAFYKEQIGKSTPLMVLGEFLHKMTELDKAQRYYELVIQELVDVNPVECGMAYNNIGTIYTDRQQENKALEYFRKALSIYSISLPKRHLHVAEVYSNMASAYIEIDAFKFAVKYFRKTLKIQRALLANDDIELATTYNNMANLYNRLEKHKKELAFLKMTVTIEQGKLPAKHPDLAITYNNMGRAYLSLADYVNANDCLRKALDIRLISLPTNHTDLGDTYFALGSLAHETGDSVNALENYQKALRIFSSEKSNIDLYRLSQVHSDLGLFFLEQKLYKASIKHLKSALLYEKQKEHMDICSLMTIHNNMAEVHLDRKNYKLATNYCRKSLKLNAKYANVYYSIYLKTQCILADIYRLTKKLNKACHLYKWLIDQYHADNQSENILFLSYVYKKMSFLYELKNQQDLSLYYIKRSLKIQLRYGPTDYNVLAESYKIAGDLYASNEKNIRLAIRFYKKAIDTYSKESMPESISLAETYIVLAELLYRVEQLSKARSFFLKAHDLLRGTNLGKWYHFSKIFYFLGTIAYQRQEYKISKKYCQRGLFYLFKRKIRNDRLTSNDILDMIVFINKITDVLIKELNLSKAQFYCGQALKCAQVSFEKTNAEEQLQIALAITHFNLGFIKTKKNKFRRAGKEFQSAYTILRQYPSVDPRFSGLIAYHMGVIWQKKQLYDKALPCFRNARRFAHKSVHPGKYKDLGKAYTLIAICYQHQKEASPFKARSNYRKAQFALQQSQIKTEDDFELIKIIETNLNELSTTITNRCK